MIFAVCRLRASRLLPPQILNMIPSSIRDYRVDLDQVRRYFDDIDVVRFLCAAVGFRLLRAAFARAVLAVAADWVVGPTH